MRRPTTHASALLLLGLLVACSKPAAVDRTTPRAPEAVAPASGGGEAPPSADGPSEDALKPELAADPTDGSAAPVKVVFDWSPPCRVPVVQDVLKNGRGARTRMNVVLEKSGEDRKLTLRDFEFVTLNGVDATSSPANAPGSLARKLVSMIPDGLVAHDGTFRGVPDVDAFGERAATLFAASNDPEERKLATVFRLPAAKAAMAGDLGMTWMTWVEAWIHVSFPTGIERRTTVTKPVAGQMLTFPETVVNRGPVKGAPGLVLLSVHDVMEGPETERAFKGMMTTLLKQAAVAPPPADAAAEAYSGMRVERTFTAAIDPRTARPYRARYEMRLHMNGNEAVDIRDAMFEWNKAVGCGLAGKGAP